MFSQTNDAKFQLHPVLVTMGERGVSQMLTPPLYVLGVAGADSVPDVLLFQAERALPMAFACTAAWGRWALDVVLQALLLLRTTTTLHRSPQLRDVSSRTPGLFPAVLPCGGR